MVKAFVLQLVGLGLIPFKSYWKSLKNGSVLGARSALKRYRYRTGNVRM